ncbi:Beta-lactamase class C-like and penicillin binding proteins (PBPs) superfamily, partial [hydrothermal vent metagenome]
AMCVLLLCMFFSVSFGQEFDEDANFVRGNIGQRIADWAEAAASVGFHGVILAARDGEVVAVVAVGSADFAGKVRNTPTTLFEIASITKPFTAIAIMQLVEQGALALDDPIAKHLPGVPDDCRAITVRQLLQHTSGIPGTNSRGGGPDLDAVLPRFLQGGPVFEPGTHWEYWNQGYALLSEIVARASGQEYVTFCRDRIFVPAGMASTRFTGDEAPEGVPVAIGRSSYGKPRSALDHPYGSYGFQYRGMGGVVTNVWDLWRWDRALHGEELLGAAAKAELFEPGLGDYALGWFVRETKGGRLVQSHGGGVRGFVSEVRRYPLDDGCLFVLCNNDAVPVGRIAQALEEILFEEAPTIEKPPAPLDEALREALVGQYEDDRGNLFIIEAEGNLTRVRILWSSSKGLVTRAVLGLDEAGGVAMYEWRSTHAVELDRHGEEPVGVLSILNTTYTRQP